MKRRKENKKIMPPLSFRNLNYSNCQIMQHQLDRQIEFQIYRYIMSKSRIKLSNYKSNPRIRSRIRELRVDSIQDSIKLRVLYRWDTDQEISKDMFFIRRYWQLYKEAMLRADGGYYSKQGEGDERSLGAPRASELLNPRPSCCSQYY